jgi:hypothetical protein
MGAEHVLLDGLGVDQRIPDLVAGGVDGLGGFGDQVL